VDLSFKPAVRAASGMSRSGGVWRRARQRPADSSGWSCANAYIRPSRSFALNAAF
jgi:hypothetical protein